MASVLAVVAGSPAQAANTASEHMVDTNDDGKADSREFAGADRYETALKLANRYTNAQGGLGAVSTVILASGETLIDAVTSAALSAVKQAPVLLTRSTGISRGVADFIEDNGVTNVVIVGGTAVIPDAVADEVENLESEPTVSRIWGDDRSATAAAIAEELPGGAHWCGTDETAAILVNGSDGPAIDAIAASPLVYALELPMLLTAADELAEATSEFLSDEDIERVVIVGGESAVSKDVQDAVDGMNIKTQRVSNGERSGTSVELTKLVLGEGACADEVAADSQRVALINSEATADGVSAAPVLGRGLGGGMIPVLLIDDTLPPAVRDYLAETPVEAAGIKQHLTVVAIGGTAVVSDSVMAAAVAAASSSDALTATIKAKSSVPGMMSNTIDITFNDDVGGDKFKDQIKDVIYVNGSPASVLAGDAGITDPMSTPAANATCGTAQKITVTLTHDLKAGDEIEIRPSKVKFGDDNDDDRRMLQASSFTVPVPDRDETGPLVEVIAVQGEPHIYLLASETGNVDASKVSVKSARAPANGVPIATEVVGAPTTIRASDRPELAPFGAVRYRLDVASAGDSYDLYAKGTAKDRITLERGAVTDSVVPTPNGNRRAVELVDQSKKSFKAMSVKISAVDSGVDDDPATLKVPNMIANVSTAAHYAIEGADGVTIKAKWAGAASGAAGNGWQVTVDEAAGLDPLAKMAEIDVSVNKRNKVIRVRYIDGSPTKGDLVAALNGDSAFADMFMASTPCDDDNAKEDLARTVLPGGMLTGGLSSVAFMVTFSDYVKMLRNDGADLRDDILKALVAGYDSDMVAASGDAIDDSMPYSAQVRFLKPYHKVQMLFTTQDASKIPGLRTGPAKGIVTIGGDDPKKLEQGDAVVYVAESYFANVVPDTGDDLVMENQNSAARLRVARDSKLAVK
jgi:putative cell wall-binding protein